MKNLVEELKRYFETTPQDKILEDWAKTEKYDKVGPTCDEFLKSYTCHHEWIMTADSFDRTCYCKKCGKSN